MSRSPMLPQKRPHAGSSSQLPSLPEMDKRVYELIKSRKDMGIWTADIKREVGISDTAVNKILRSLRSKNLVKDVQNIHNKGRKIIMAMEFEPSEEVTGGSWYTEGHLDTEFIDILRRMCLKYIQEHEVARVEDIWKSIINSPVLKVECSEQQVSEIVGSLLFDKEIEEIKSNGVGIHIPPGKKCYRSLKGGEESKGGYFSSIPCGVCPRISECTPEGIISPKTCVYYKKWLEIEF